MTDDPTPEPETPPPPDLPDEVADGDAGQGEPETPDATEGVPI